jgi:hypothetical protein
MDVGLGGVNRSSARDKVVGGDVGLEGTLAINVADNSVVLAESSSTDKEGLVTDSVEVVSADAVNVWEPVPVVRSSENGVLVEVRVEDDRDLSLPVEASSRSLADNSSNLVVLRVSDDGAEGRGATVSEDAEGFLKSKVVGVRGTHKVSEVVKGDNVRGSSSGDIRSAVSRSIADRDDLRSVVEAVSIGGDSGTTIDKEGKDVLVIIDRRLSLEVLFEELRTVLSGRVTAPSGTNRVDGSAGTSKVGDGADEGGVSLGALLEGDGRSDVLGSSLADKVAEGLEEVRIVEALSNDGDELVTTRKTHTSGSDSSDCGAIVVLEGSSLLSESRGLLVAEAGALEANTKVADDLVDLVVNRDITDNTVLIAGRLRGERSSREEALPVVDTAASKGKTTDGDGGETSNVTALRSNRADDRTIVELLAVDSVGSLAGLGSSSPLKTNGKKRIPSVIGDEAAKSGSRAGDKVNATELVSNVALDVVVVGEDERVLEVGSSNGNSITVPSVGNTVLEKVGRLG